MDKMDFDNSTFSNIKAVFLLLRAGKIWDVNDF